MITRDKMFTIINDRCNVEGGRYPTSVSNTSLLVIITWTIFFGIAKLFKTWSFRLYTYTNYVLFNYKEKTIIATKC